MDRAQDILEYLSQAEAARIIILAPNAPPISRELSGIGLPLNLVLDPSDVTDTLMGLRSKAAVEGSATFGRSGSFSFGVKDVGRIRVNYATQRGSKVISILRIPFRVPDLRSVCDDTAAVDRLLEVMDSGRSGFLTIYGPSAISNSILAYALLKHVNDSTRKVLYVLERALTFLMAHDNSVVIQTELNSDVHSLEEGIQNAFLFEPDFLYIGDIWRSDEFPSVRHAVKSGVLAILTSVGLDGEMLLEKLQPLRTAFDDGEDEMVVEKVRVMPVANDKITISLIK